VADIILVEGCDFVVVLFSGLGVKTAEKGRSRIKYFPDQPGRLRDLPLILRKSSEARPLVKPSDPLIDAEQSRAHDNNPVRSVPEHAGGI
jgi:hypothetical protein